MKYNLSYFTDAMDRIANRSEEFACCSIDCDNSWTIEKSSSYRFKHRLFFEKLFGIEIESATFNNFYLELYGKIATREELIEIRLLALAFAHELARIHNNSVKPAKLKQVLKTYNIKKKDILKIKKTIDENLI